jgi:hypothetical protein
MKTHRIAAGLGLAFVLLAGTVLADGKLKSGPQPGQDVPGPFTPLNVTGSSAGEKHCLYCENGQNPVAMVFARELTPEVAKLLKKLDGCTVKNSGCDMGSFVVFLNDQEGLDKKLKSLANKENLKKLVLSIEANTAGPEKYHINKSADVTVVLYTNRVVKANHAFKKGELKDGDINTIVKDVTKITPKD